MQRSKQRLRWRSQHPRTMRGRSLLVWSQLDANLRGRGGVRVRDSDHAENVQVPGALSVAIFW